MHMTLALIGYGYWGPNIARNAYRNPKITLHSICDKKEAMRAKAKDLYAESVRYESDYKRLLQDDRINAVAIAVETPAHKDLVLECLAAGKHVFCEKPLTDSLADAKEIEAAARKAERCVHVDHIMLYHPAIQKIKAIYDRGDLGDILYVHCSRINLGQVKNDVNSMWDLSVHDLSIVDYLTNGAPVQTVEALGSKAFSSHHSSVFMLLQYQGFIAQMTSSWVSPIKERKIIIAGSKRMLVYDDVEILNKLIIYDKGFDGAKEDDYQTFAPKARSGDGWIPKIEAGDALYNSLEHFRTAIHEQGESSSSPAAAIRIIEALEAGDRALKMGRQILRP